MFRLRERSPTCILLNSLRSSPHRSSILLFFCMICFLSSIFSPICSRIVSCLWNLMVPWRLDVITITPCTEMCFSSLLMRTLFNGTSQVAEVVFRKSQLFLRVSFLRVQIWSVLCSNARCCLLVSRSVSVLNCKKAFVIGFAGRCASSSLSSIARSLISFCGNFFTSSSGRWG